MENFGERLSVDDIWRVVLFVKTIPNGTLAPNRVPEPKDYITWKPSKELLAWLASRQKLQNNESFTSANATDPYMEEARRVFPGLSPGDSIVVGGLGTPLSLQDAANGIRALYQQMLDRAWADAKRRGDTLPPESQKNVPPQVEGQQ
jgi:hypothetical protein